MSIQCPKCKKINPKINTSSNTHYVETCKTIIGTKTILFGLLTIPKKCNHFLVFDDHEDYIIINDNIVKPICKCKEKQICDPSDCALNC